MANLRSLVIESGTRKQVGNADTLIVGAGIDAGSAAALNIGTGVATSITIGSAGIDTIFPGPVKLDGDVTTVGGTVFQTDATFEGNVTFGDGPADTVAFHSSTLIVSSMVFDDAGATYPYAIQNIKDPVNDQDAATKFYVDNALGSSTLQSAYENGNTITTSAAEGAVTINGDQDFVLGGTVDFNLTTTGAITGTGLGGLIDLQTTSTVELRGGAGAEFGDDVASLDFDGAGAVTETGMTSLTLSPSGAISLDAGTASQFTTAAGNLLFQAGNEILLQAAVGQSVIVNGAGVNVDFRVGGAGDPNLIFADASVDRVGVGTATPNEKLTVNGVLSLAEGATPSLTSGFGKFYVQSTDARPYFLDEAGDRYNLTLDRFNTLTAGATVTIDTYPELPIYNTVSINQNTTFSTTNLGNGRGASVRVVGDGTTRTLSFPGSWEWLGSGAPAELAANEVGFLSIVAYGATDADVVAAWSYSGQPESVTGSGVDDQISVWSGTYTQDGSSKLTFDSQTATSTLTVQGNISQSLGAVTLTANAASSFTTSAGSLTLTSAGLMDVNAGASLDVDVTGTMDFLASGAFSIDGTGASNVSADSGNLTLSTTTAGDVVLSAVEDIDADAVNVLIDASSAFSIDGAAASNVSVTGAELSLSTITSGELDLTSAGLLDVNAGANLDVDVTGTMDFLASGAFSIDGTGASNVSATSGDLVISTITSGELDLTSAGLMDVNAGASLDVDVTGTMDFLSSGAFSIDGTGASNVSAASGNLTLSTTTAGDVVLSAAANIDADAVSVFIDASSAFSIDGAAASNVSVTGADLSLSTLTSGTLALASAGLVDIDAAANLDVDVTGTMDFLSSGAFSIDGTGASNVTATSGDLTLSTVTSGAINLTASGNFQITTNGLAALTWPTTFPGDDTYLRHTSGGVLSWEPALTLAEMDTTTNAVAQGDAVYVSSGGAPPTVNEAIATSAASSRVLGVASSVADQVELLGIISACNFETSLTLAVGEPVFLSASTAGKMTNVAPSGAGEYIAELGIIVRVITASGGDGAADILWQPKAIVGV